MGNHRDKKNVPIWIIEKKYIKIIINSMNNLITEIIFSLLIIVDVLYFSHYFVKNKKTKKIIKNNKIFHPNSISYLRMPLGIFSMILLYYGFETSAILLFVFAAITDASDGIIARGCDLATKKGKWLDPLSDKLVYFAPLLYFWIIWKINLILVVIFVFIDVLGQFSRILLKKVKKEWSANIYGKIKTTFVFILIFYLIIFENKHIINISDTYNDICMWIAIMFWILSLVFKFIPNKK